MTTPCQIKNNVATYNIAVSLDFHTLRMVPHIVGRFKDSRATIIYVFWAGMGGMRPWGIH